jgi:molybdenum cofactor cytidylyltransferase
MTIRISAIILAAGLSSRMGQPKLLLPWGETTILGQVISTFAAAGVDEIIVVTGGARTPVETLVNGLAKSFPVRAVYNPEFEQGGMLGSLQCGIKAIPHLATSHICTSNRGDSGGQEGALIGLGDQPQVREETVRRICEAFARTGTPLVIPSYQNRRGHPWLVARPLWLQLMALPVSTPPRQFLKTYTGPVEYVPADATILQDLDTPEEYSRQRP